MPFKSRANRSTQYNYRSPDTSSFNPFLSHRTEDVVAEFERFGVIGDVYRPTDLGVTVIEKSVLFIRYFSIKDANAAQVSFLIQNIRNIDN